MYIVPFRVDAYSGGKTVNAILTELTPKKVYVFTITDTCSLYDLHNYAVMFYPFKSYTIGQTDNQKQCVLYGRRLPTRLIDGQNVV